MNIIHHEVGRDPLYKIWNYSTTNMILYTYSDGGSVVFRDRIYPIKKGMLCFIRSNKQHYTMPDRPEVYDRSKIFLSDDIFNRMIELFPGNSLFTKLFRNSSVIYAQIPEEQQSVVEEIYAEAARTLPNIEMNSEVFVCCYLRLMRYLKQYKRQQTVVADNFMVRAVTFINNNYPCELSLEELCAEMHMSKYYFCHKFKETMGITVMEYLLKTRLAAAKDILLFTDMAIGEVSEKCGFSSVSYFCQVFRSNTGMTPGEYRKNNEENHQTAISPTVPEI